MTQAMKAVIIIHLGWKPKYNRCEPILRCDLFDLFNCVYAGDILLTPLQ